MTNGERKSLKPDLAVTTAQAIVDRVCPGAKVAAVSRLHGGEISAVYELVLAEGQAPLVLKAYPDALHWKMHKELTVAALLQDQIVAPMPRILLTDDSKSLLGLNFIVMSKLNGEILLGLENSLTEEELLEAYRCMGQVLRGFHRVAMDAFGYIGPQGVWTEHPSNHAYMGFQFDNKLKEFNNRGGDSMLAQRVGSFVSERTCLLQACARPVLCHNDFHAGNVLVTRSSGSVQLSGVVDFENALAGDPLMDVAKTLSYAVRENPAKRAALLRGYGPIERPEWPETVELYRLYCALELWCWMAQIGDEEPLQGLARDMERFVNA